MKRGGGNHTRFITITRTMNPLSAPENNKDTLGRCLPRYRWVIHTAQRGDFYRPLADYIITAKVMAKAMWTHNAH